MSAINTRIANELNVQVAQVTAAVDLLGEGATVPFIARYRKEKTGGLDDTQLRKLEERLDYLRQLDDRRTTVLKSISEQGKLTPELERDIHAALDKVTLEDLFRIVNTARTEARDNQLENSARFTSLEQNLASMRGDLAGLRADQATLAKMIADQSGRIDRLAERFDRIERRLDLSDAPAG